MLRLCSPCLSPADEIDAIGTKRYDSNSSGEREVQRTMLELLNQLDGFDERGDVKVRGLQGIAWWARASMHSGPYSRPLLFCAAPR